MATHICSQGQIRTITITGRASPQKRKRMRRSVKSYPETGSNGGGAVAVGVRVGGVAAGGRVLQGVRGSQGGVEERGDDLLRRLRQPGVAPSSMPAAATAILQIRRHVYQDVVRVCAMAELKLQLCSAAITVILKPRLFISSSLSLFSTFPLFFL